MRVYLLDAPNFCYIFIITLFALTHFFCSIDALVSNKFQSNFNLRANKVVTQVACTFGTESAFKFVRLFQPSPSPWRGAWPKKHVEVKQRHFDLLRSILELHGNPQATDTRSPPFWHTPTQRHATSAPEPLEPTSKAFPPPQHVRPTRNDTNAN